MLPTSFVYIFTFIFGIAVGSFLNVCIYRIPDGGDIVREPSHCMSCGYKLAWYDLIPVVSWIVLGGKCRKCGAKVSAQYPFVELLNGVLWVITLVLCGINAMAFIYCCVISCLIVLTWIDARTFEIPFGVSVFVLAAAVVATVLYSEDFKSHIIGMLIISVPLGALYFISGGRAIGGGDVKLMFGAGLLLGAANTLVAFFMSCLLASVIHIGRMKLSGAEHKLAMGPYISGGILISMWFGNPIVTWYLGLLGI